MKIKMTSLYRGDIYQKITLRKEFSPGKYETVFVGILYKEKAILLKVNNGYIDIDNVKDEKTLKATNNILGDIIPFEDEEGTLYVNPDSIESLNNKGSISFKKLKKERLTIR